MRRRLQTLLLLGAVALALLVATAATTEAITKTGTTATATTTTTTTATTATSTTAPATTKPDAPATTKPTPTKPGSVTSTTATSTTKSTPAAPAAGAPARTTPNAATDPTAAAEAAADDADAAVNGTGTSGNAAVDAGDSAVPTTDPTLPDAPGPPPVHALSWLVVDAGDGTELAGHAVATKRAIASLTKVMNAYITIQRTRGSELVPIDRHALESDGGSTLSMQPGQTYKLDDLLDATLVHSANDGAVALAEYVGGGGADGEAAFRKMMNDVAGKLGMADSRYTSVNGLDGLTGGDVPSTRSTARDLIKLLDAAWGEPRFRHAVGLETFDFERAGQTTLSLPNRNTLVGTYPGVDGVKTGHTDAAGYCLLTHYSGPEGKYWVVVLGDRAEATRDSDTKALLDWARTLRPDVQLATAGDRVGEAPVDDGGTATHGARLYLSRDLHARVRIGQSVSERLVVPGRLRAPLRAGDEVGRFEVLAAGKVVARSRVYVDRPVHRTTRRQRARRLVHQLPKAARLGARTVHRQERRFMDFWGL